MFHTYVRKNRSNRFYTFWWCMWETRFQPDHVETVARKKHVRELHPLTACIVIHDINSTQGWNYMFSLSHFSISFAVLLFTLPENYVYWESCRKTESTHFNIKENDFLIDQQALLCKALISSSILGYAILIWISTFTPLCLEVATKLLSSTILPLKSQSEAETKINNKKHLSLKVLFWR